MDTKWILLGVSVALIVFLFNKYFIQIYGYWRKRGIPSLDGTLPFFGNSLPILLLRQSVTEFCQDIYEKYQNRSVVGFFQFRNPTLVIRDPELVKTVLISGFSNFHENILSINPKLDPLLALNPFFSSGETWKTQRSRLSYALTSKRLKVLCSAVTNVCTKFSKYLEDNVRKSNGCYEVEAKKLFSSFTGEVVASGGFGVEGDFFSNGSGPNSFRETIGDIFDTSFINYVKNILLFFAPSLNIFVQASFLPKRIDNFFRRIVSEMLAVRQKEGIVRNDFLQVMLDSHKDDVGETDELGVAGSATSFFIDGYETSAITLVFFTYQIAANPDIQDKLRREVNTVLEKHDGEITYEALNEITYMDQAFNESMRIYPALGFLTKKCTRQCQLVGNDGIECVIEPGTEVIIPVQALQNDPEYWNNPQIYDPERFTEENKKDRPKTVYLPFGEGPRICVGMRFAIMQMKAAMTTIIRNYSIEISPKTHLPVRLKRSAFLAAVDGGMWIKIKPL